MVCHTKPTLCTAYTNTKQMGINNRSQVYRDQSPLLLVGVIRIDSGMFSSWQPLLWPRLSSVSRPFHPRPTNAAQATLTVSLLLLAGDVELNPGPIMHINMPDWITSAV
jgi:hypothetical protein